ncbi:MAG: hypothetical protein AYL32_009340 [Candidatus Bathyarchaeota archaeon B26-2]|nr:MAG: hypothetical protein AYL32_009340 [Candidatus Bathyarchaeota archaeon B26-2]
MARRRSHIEISADILRIARTGARKTRIVYGANLNFKLLNEYLDKLEKAGLIARDPKKTGIIRTTEKGRKYLQQYENLKDFGML